MSEFKCDYCRSSDIHFDAHICSIDALREHIDDLEKQLGWAAEWYGENWIYNEENQDGNN